MYTMDLVHTFLSLCYYAGIWPSTTNYRPPNWVYTFANREQEATLYIDSRTDYMSLYLNFELETGLNIDSNTLDICVNLIKEHLDERDDY